MDFWQKTITEAINNRRLLHQKPEIAWQENQTAEFVRSRLTELGIQWRACTDTGTVATLGPNNAQHNIALRADIDALPIQELTNLPHQSCHSGYMHACGHDGHTATLLAATNWLKKHEHTLKNKITLIFQPAEEGEHGAKKMIEQGALDGVNEIYGWHNWPALPFGQIYCPNGLVMCGNGVFTIKVKGVGGHSSQPEQCCDPVLAASAIHLALQSIIARRIAPQAPAVLSVTSIEAPSGLTVIPEHATLSGSIRIPDEATRGSINHLIEEISHNTAAAYGVTCSVDIHNRYSATINHPEQAHNTRQLWQQIFGEHTVIDPSAPPIMASEDFSYYLKEIPGAFALVGANESDAAVPSCHSAYYDFNDNLIPKVTQLFCALAGAPAPQ